MVNHEFPHQLEEEFNRLYHESTEIQAELTSLVDIGEENFEKILSSNNYERYKRLITAMSVTSRKTTATFDALNAICLAGLENANGHKRYIKGIKEIQEEIKTCRLQDLSYIEKLPFSMGEGWKAGGSISTGRRILNRLPALILVLPAYVAIKKEATYHASLREFEELAELHQEVMDGKKDGSRYEIGQDIKKSFKTLKSFLRISKQIYRSYSKSRSRCKKIWKNASLSDINISDNDINRHLVSYHRRNNELDMAA